MSEPRLYTDDHLIAFLREMANRRTRSISAREKLHLAEAAEVIRGRTAGPSPSEAQRL